MAEEIKGLVEPGNIDLNDRPVVTNPDGTISTVRSMGVNIEGKELLIPMVSDDGRVLSEDEAISLYEETGRHLGVFDSPDSSTSYAKRLSSEQSQQYSSDAQTTEVPPWNKEWGRSSVNENIRDQLIEQDIPPWEKEWGRVPQYDLPAFNDMMGTGGSVDFENVFERLIQAESRGRHRDASGRLTRSPVGAQGITQVMPKTAKNPGYGVKPIQDDSEEEYIRFGREYLTAMWNEFDGDARKALAAYNAGPGNVKKAVRQAEESGKSWEEHLPKRSETIPYMDKILGEE